MAKKIVCTTALWLLLRIIKLILFLNIFYIICVLSHSNSMTISDPKSKLYPLANPEVVKRGQKGVEMDLLFLKSRCYVSATGGEDRD